jgi:hypothetical protein
MVDVVITKVKRAHEHGWYARGESLPSSTYSGSAKVWDGSTQYTELSKLLPTCYITKSVWDSLDIGVKRDIKNKVTAVVESNWLSKGSGIHPRGGRYYTRDFNASSIIDGYKDESITSPEPEPEHEPEPEPEPPTDDPVDEPETDEPDTDTPDNVDTVPGDILAGAIILSLMFFMMRR